MLSRKSAIASSPSQCRMLVLRLITFTVNSLDSHCGTLNPKMFNVRFVELHEYELILCDVVAQSFYAGHSCTKMIDVPGGGVTYL